MTVAEVILVFGGVGTLLTGAAAWVKARSDKRSGATGDEREDRRDDRADWAAFAASMQRALDGERAESTQLRDDLAQKLAAKDVRIDELERRLEQKALLLRAGGDHIDLLESDIRALGGTPRPRPAGI